MFEYAQMAKSCVLLGLCSGSPWFQEGIPFPTNALMFVFITTGLYRRYDYCMLSGLTRFKDQRALFRYRPTWCFCNSYYIDTLPAQRLSCRVSL